MATACRQLTNLTTGKGGYDTKPAVVVSQTPDEDCNDTRGRKQKKNAAKARRKKQKTKPQKV